MSTVFIVVVLVVVFFLIYVASRPNTFRVERSIDIKAPPGKIFTLINDFHQWPSWSPWEKMDPAMKKTHSGASQGLGAIYEWEGNNKVGKGRMEIARAIPDAEVEFKLDFVKPFEAHNTARFRLATNGAITRVTWAMDCSRNFMFKLMGVLMNMDKMMGRDFEAGLANLKGLAEQ